jgi:hypothetical protein
MSSESYRKTNKMKRGLVKIFLLTIVVLISYQLLILSAWDILFGENFYTILIFFFIQSIALHTLFILGQKYLELTVPLLVMAAMSIRLITSLMVVVIFVMTGVNDQVNFIITFFTIYLFYFVFEIISVLSNLRSN